jgi:hypothetical protein
VNKDKFISYKETNKLTFLVITDTTYGATIPGIVANVFEIPNKTPEYLPPTSLTLTV